MDGVSEEEQLYSDLDWYATDRDGRIGQFLTGGAKLLPPLVALDKNALNRLSEYFRALKENGDSTFCPDFHRNFPAKHVAADPKEHMPFSQAMSRRGLYSYDSATGFESRCYIRVSLQGRPVKVADLPEDIRILIVGTRLENISFKDDRVIPDALTREMSMLRA
ncbi:MAG: hypothetical protein ABI539_07900 [Acidobacteriota bacterium]